MRRLALPIFVTFLFAVPSTAGAAAPGGITQLPNPLGCLTNGGSGGCTSVHDMARNLGNAMSPDGKNVYVASFDNSALLVFDRNASNGGLTQKSGRQGCFVNGAATATCSGANGLSNPIGIAVAPNGKTVYVANRGSGNNVLSFTRNTTTGTLTQKSGAAGCIANTGDGTTCRDGRAMSGPSFITVTGDGKHLYVASEFSDAVSALSIGSDGSLTQIGDGSGGSGCVENVPSADGCADGRALDGPFSINASSANDTIYVAGFSGSSVAALGRDPATGRLAPLPGTAGCVSATGADGCSTDPDLSNPRDVAGAPGGKHIYVASTSSSKLLLYDRLASGGLVKRAGTDGCIAETADAGCRQGRGMSGASRIVVSAAGEDLYLASFNGNAGLAEFDRNGSTGVLSERPGTRGCVVAGTEAGCASSNQVSSMYDLKLSPDGRFIYVGSFSVPGFGVFRRDSSGPVCGPGGATVGQGTLTVLQFPCRDPDGDPVSFTIVNPPTIGGLGLIDEAHDQVGYAASQGQCGNTAFTFRATSSGQTSPNQTFPISVVGCPTGGGGGGGGTTPPLTVVPSTVSINSLAFPKFTKLVSLAVKNVQAGTTVVVTCKTKKKKQQKKSCPYKKKRLTSTGARSKLTLSKPFKKKKLPVGTKLSITITAPGFLGKRITYTVRKRKVPKSKVQCLSASGKAGSCA
jgi:DNA-binding beta-propeller fold protein YncE